MRIAMWSGPRNLSTAMMYSFAQRDDCSVVDEPFYAAYLSESGLDHPMRSEILQSQDTSSRMVSARLADFGTPLRYEKNMTHHMLPGWDLGWLRDVANVFLIRHPARVIASYAAKRQNPTADDLGYRQQFELFEHVISLGQTPIVVDSFDVRADPDAALRRLCAALSIAFMPEMLRWPRGPKPYDGVWAPHWYDAVHQSTGFAAREGEVPEIPEHQDLLRETLPAYEAMRAAIA